MLGLGDHRGVCGDPEPRRLRQPDPYASGQGHPCRLRPAAVGVGQGKGQRAAEETAGGEGGAMKGAVIALVLAAFAAPVLAQSATETVNAELKTFAASYVELFNK